MGWNNESRGTAPIRRKLTAKEFVKYEDVADPKITRPAGVIDGAGVCPTDLHEVEDIWRSKVDVKLPYITGRFH